jgi:hypothetical protein
MPCDELITLQGIIPSVKNIMKLRKQPYAPKWEEEERERQKKAILVPLLMTFILQNFV